ncbi:MAG: hypothetical protein P8P98_03720 [Emcibacteraceae bacterium]|nr:hypothetical protein [Emcibacteraceae bacterium]MDG1997299.1 hypothetical protein [Emcibacteraceae bacterium]
MVKKSKPKSKSKPKKKDIVNTALVYNDPPRELVGSDDLSFMNVLFNDLLENMYMPEGLSDEQIVMRDDAARETLRQIAPQDGIEGMLAVQMASTYQTSEGRNTNLKFGEKLIRL